MLPRRVSLLEEFDEHPAADAKKLIEIEATGSKTYRYVRTGTNHYSLAFTYDWIASEERRFSSRGFIIAGGETIMGDLVRSMRNEGFEWPSRWDKVL